jgi:dihydrofolate reductase
MGKINVHEFVSLDGVFENPSWTAEFGFTEGMGQAIASFTATSSAILLGRRTFEMFAPAWSTRSVEDDPGVPFFNDTPKYVVSSSLTSADAWQNSTVLGGYDAQAISELKQQDGDVYISGSGTLVRALVADGLVDELHLLVYPVVLGAGARLFPEGTPRTSLALSAHEAFENGVLHLTYGPAAR